MSPAHPRLEQAFPSALDRLDSPLEGRVVVALSGGVDSLVLLHLLRFHPDAPALDLHAAHFDHRMRPGSGGDARWVAGLARAWGVPLTVGRADQAPRTEAQARTARYAFLHRVQEQMGARRVLTAHHADDQAETVLFRVLRGTGLPGLAGIPATRDPGVARPLLPFWKSQILGYARRARLRPRVDPSNRDPGFARNRIRHDLLPRLERDLASGARNALVGLAARASENERAWDAVMDALLTGARSERTEGAISVDLAVLLAYDSAVAARVLREMARRLGAGLDAGATQAALEFARTAASGRAMGLAGGVELRRDFHRLGLRRAPAEPRTSDALDLDATRIGSGALRLDGRTFRVHWSPEGAAEGRWVERFALGPLPLPLRLRGWRSGDRIRMAYGSKKLKKLLAEARIPVPDRRSRPVLADALGGVLWVPGVARSSRGSPTGAEPALSIGIAHVDPS